MGNEIHEQGVDTLSGFDMSREEVQQLCLEFLNNQENPPATRLGCYLISGQDRFSNLGKYVEGGVFSASFGNTSEILHQEYDGYDKASTFFVVIDQEANLPVGAMRIIENSDMGLKTLVDLKKTPLKISADQACEAYGIDPNRCVDLATVAVLPDYRGDKADYMPSALLYRTLYLTTLSNPRFDHVICIIDEKALRGLQFYKFPFKSIFGSEAFSYLDSPKSYAMYARNSTFYPQASYWAGKFQEEAAQGGNDRKKWLGQMIEFLINGGPADEMLGFNSQDHLLKH